MLFLVSLDVIAHTPELVPVDCRWKKFTTYVRAWNQLGNAFETNSGFRVFTWL